jgi:hypothetical protein
MKIVVLLLSLFLVGCATAKDVHVSIPVMRQEAIKLPAAPDLPIYHLDSNSKPDQVAKAYVVSVKALLEHIDNIETVCESD